MSSSKKRKREDALNAKDAFIELRDSGLVQTGPKRPNTTLTLTPATPAAVNTRKGRGRQRKSLLMKRKSSSGGRGKKKDTMEAASQLMEADLSDLLPAQGTPITLTPLPPQSTNPPPPTPQVALIAPTPLPPQNTNPPPPTPQPTPSHMHSEETQENESKRTSAKRSTRKRRVTPKGLAKRGKKSPSVGLASPLVVETSVVRGRALKSALKDIQSLSTTRHSHQDSTSHVSFGPYVTVAEFSPDTSMDNSMDEREVDPYHPQEREVDSYHPQATPEDSTDLIDLIEPPSLDHQAPQEEDHSPDTALESLSENEEEVGGAGSDEEEVGVADEDVDVASDEEEDNEQSPRLRTPHWKERVDDRGETHEESPLPPHGASEHQSSKTKAKKHSVPKKKRSANTNKSPPTHTLPRTLIKNLFMLYTKRRLTREAMDLVMTFSEAYLKQASKDVHVFAEHAGRKTIEVEDILVLLQRQREITPSKPFEHLVNTYLPMEYIEQLLPCPNTGR